MSLCVDMRQQYQCLFSCVNTCAGMINFLVWFNFLNIISPLSYLESGSIGKALHGRGEWRRPARCHGAPGWCRQCDEHLNKQVPDTPNRLAWRHGVASNVCPSYNNNVMSVCNVRCPVARPSMLRDVSACKLGPEKRSSTTMNDLSNLYSPSMPWLIICNLKYGCVLVVLLLFCK